MNSGCRVLGFAEGYRVHAVAETARGRAIGEDMAEVRSARVADGFDALQEAGPVEVVGDDVGGQGLGKRRPACTGLEFLGRIEEDGAATEARIDTRLEQAAHLGTEGTLGAGLAGDVVLLGGQLPAPFGICFFHAAIGIGVAVFGKVQDVGPLKHHAHFNAQRSGTSWMSAAAVEEPSNAKATAIHRTVE